MAEKPNILSLAAAEAEKRKREGTWSGGVQAHVEYQDRPVDWMVEKLGIAENSIRWGLNPEYQCCYCPRCVALGNEGKPHLWDGAEEPLERALNLVFAGKWVAVPAGTAVSKTYILGAALALTFLAVRPYSIVCSIAPKHELLLKNLWKNMGQMLPAFKKHFPAANMLTGTLRMLDGEGEKEVWTASAYGAGEGTDEELAGSLKGFHHPNMLWIIEEGQRVSGAKVETIVKTAGGEFNPIIMLGNPSDQHDQLAAFARRPRVTQVRISALDFPNVVCGRDVIPGGRSRQSVLDDLEEENGDESARKYLTQVRGIAPAESEAALIRQEWCDASAAKQGSETLRDGPPALGIDVADSPAGDKSAFSRWQGAVCTEVTSFRASDAGEVGRIAHREITNPLNPINPRHVGVDAIGVGASCVNELKRLGVKVRRIYGSGRAMPTVVANPEDGKKVVGAELYANERSAVFWTLREDIRLCRIAIPRDPLLFEELTAMEYEPTPKIRVLEKEDIKRKIGRSPDRADALAYGNYVRQRTPVKKKEAEKKPDRNTDTGLEKYLDRHAKSQAARKRGRVR